MVCFFFPWQSVNNVGGLREHMGKIRATKVVLPQERVGRWLVKVTYAIASVRRCGAVRQCGCPHLPRVLNDARRRTMIHLRC